MFWVVCCCWFVVGLFGDCFVCLCGCLYFGIVGFGLDDCVCCLVVVLRARWVCLVVVLGGIVFVCCYLLFGVCCVVFV